MKKIKMPDTFVIIFFVVIFASLLTYIVPVGKFEMQEVTYVTNTGAEKTINFHFHHIFQYIPHFLHIYKLNLSLLLLFENLVFVYFLLL